MSEKKKLAKKSIGYQTVTLFLSILFSVIGIISLNFLENQEGETYLLVVILFIFGVFELLHFLIMVVKPLYRIEYDDQGIYINNSSSNVEFIPYSQIIKVIQKNSSARAITYSFGTIKIETIETTYSVRFISSVDDVKTTLVSLIEKWKIGGSHEK